MAINITVVDLEDRINQLYAVANLCCNEAKEYLIKANEIEKLTKDLSYYFVVWCRFNAIHNYHLALDNIKSLLALGRRRTEICFENWIYEKYLNKDLPKILKKIEILSDKFLKSDLNGHRNQILSHQDTRRVSSPILLLGLTKISLDDIKLLHEILEEVFLIIDEYFDSNSMKIDDALIKGHATFWANGEDIERARTEIFKFIENLLKE